MRTYRPNKWPNSLHSRLNAKQPRHRAIAPSMQISFEFDASFRLFDSTLSHLHNYGRTDCTPVDSCLCRVIDSSFSFFPPPFHIGIDINERRSSPLSLYPRVERIFSFLQGNFNQFPIVRRKRMLFNSGGNSINQIENLG